jgi:hypothetical protein
MSVESRYLNGDYLKSNPDWDRADAQWKSDQVCATLKRHKLTPNSFCEVGCGSGDILRNLRIQFPKALIVGYDISPQAQNFWQETEGINFYLADFHEANQEKFDVLLMIDVFEHVRDPFTFLERSRSHARYFIFHIPLDLSAISVVREKTLLSVRRKVGHLHFYNKDIALETLADCGYRVLGYRYTEASLTMPNRSLKTRIANLPRQLLSRLDKDLAARLLGGETLIVIAE